MTLRYPLLSCVLLAAGVMAQTIAPRATLQEPTFNDAVTTARPLADLDGSRDGGDVLFNEDFANGLAGNNGFGEWNVSGPHGNIWKRAIAGPNGAYIGTAGPAGSRIQSPTVSNGYMLFNSDSVNATWVGNTPTALPASEFTSWEGSLESPILDLSATPYVKIEFQQRLRYCCGTSPHYLEISTDGGFSWPTRINTAEGVGANNITETQVKSYNLTTAIAGDLSNVRFRFRHDSEAATSHYHWQIDDVKIIELYEYDMSVINVGNTYWDLNTAATYDSLHYTIFPFSQLRPLALNMNLQNNGTTTQPAVANFSVDRDGTNVLDQDQPVADMFPGELRTVFADPLFTPPAESGTYTVTYSLDPENEDMVPADNVGTSSFKVSESIYARDAGAPYAWETGDGTTMILGNMFYVHNAATLYGISVKIGTGSSTGGIVVGQLRGDNLDDVFEETQEYILTTQMMSAASNETFLDMVFDFPVELEAGRDYFVAVYTFGNVRVGESGQSADQTSFIFYNAPAGEDWYFTTTAPAVRMNFNSTVGIDEVLENGLAARLYPNPTNGSTRLAYNINESAAVTVELMDVSGKLVMSFNEGNKPAGMHEVLFDVNALDEGVYFSVLRAGDQKITNRMVVVK